jgi:hypothetical protein
VRIVEKIQGGSTMRFSSRKVLPGALAALLMMASPLGAFTLIESVGNQQKVRVAQGATFRVSINFTQAFICDRSVKLLPGQYNVEIFSMGDGSVRASFFDRTGRKAGEAHGLIIVVTPAGAAAPATTKVPAVQSPGANAHKIAPSPVSSIREAALNITTLGFQPNSRSTFSQQGLKLNLEIHGDGSHSILIGLLLPAV